MLIRGADVITMESTRDELSPTDVLVRDGIIIGIGTDLDDTDAVVIDAHGMIAMPGFVDGHRHLWESVIRGSLPDGSLVEYLGVVNGVYAPAYEPEDAYLGTLIGSLGALAAGITTVLDWSHIQNSPDHTAACINALRTAGIRAVFAFGPGAGQHAGNRHPDGIREVAGEEFSSTDQLLTLGLATLSPEHQPYETVEQHFKLAREVDALVTLHVGLRGLGEKDQVLRLASDGLLGPDVNLVHCNTLSLAEWRAIGDSGATVSITPSSEMQMGQGIPPIREALEAGVLPSLGIDVETSAGGDMWTQMRLAFAVDRMLAFQAQAPGAMPPHLISTREVLEFATRGGARSARLEQKVGTLTPGKQADIVLLRRDTINSTPVNDRLASVVHNMDARNVDTVIVAGRVVKQDGQLLGVDLDSLKERAYESRARVYRKAGLPIPDVMDGGAS